MHSMGRFAAASQPSGSKLPRHNGVHTEKICHARFEHSFNSPYYV